MANNKEPLGLRIKNFMGSLLETKETRTLASSVYWATGYAYPLENYESYAKEGYCGNADVFACVYIIQCAVGGIPWKVYGLNDKGEKDEELRTHPLALLFKRPNPHQGQAQFFAETVGNLMLSGNGYIERVGPDKEGLKAPQELYNLRSDRMKVKPGNKVQRVVGYEYGADVELKRPEVILHLKRFNPLDDWYGMSPMGPALAAIAQNNAADKWNYSIFKNMGRPSGWIKVADEVDENEYKALQKRLREGYLGIENAATPMILTGNMDWKQGSLTPVDMDFMGMHVTNTRKICAVFGVPSQLVGDETAKTYANYKEARTAFYQETVLPLLDWIKDELNAWLVPLFGGSLLIDYDRDAIEALQEDRTAEVNRELEKLKSGEAKLNETREALGDDDLGSDGDVLYIPTNVVPTPSDELNTAPSGGANAQGTGRPPTQAPKEQPQQP